MTTPNFSSFTNLYEISKTLRFELQPIGKTKELLNEQHELFPKDQRIEEIYQNIIKPCLNELHSRLIEESLEGVGLSTLDESIYQIRYAEKNGKAWQAAKTKLRKEIVRFMKNSKFHYAKGFSELMEKGVIDIIITVYGEKIYQKEDTKKQYNFEDLIGQNYKTIIEKYFKGFFTYLTNFNTNRSNLYKDDGKASRVATRTIDENLARFFQNKSLYEDRILEKNLLSLEQQEIFSVLSYSNYLNQKGIEKYNTIISQINSLTNQYNQSSRSKEEKKLPKLGELHKQILAKTSSESAFSFVDAIIESSSELETNVQQFIQQTQLKSSLVKNQIFNDLKQFDLNGIWIKRGNLKKLSAAYLQNRSILDTLLPKQRDDGEGKEEKGKTSDDIVNITQIKEVLDTQETELKEIFKSEYYQEGKSAFELFLLAIQNEVDHIVKAISDQEIVLAKNLADKSQIKSYLDQVLNLERIINYFSLVKGQGDAKEDIVVEQKDTEFYSLIEEFYKEYTPYKFYNAVRNFLTKKPFSVDKIKVNFENGTLLDGRDKNKESDNSGVILKKEGIYYLAIMKKGETGFFKQNKNPVLYEKDNSGFEKLEYKLLPGPNKMLPKVFFANNNIAFYAPSEKILSIRNHSSHTKNGDPQKGYEKKDFFLEDCHSMIDFYKSSLLKHPEWSDFGFSFKPTKEYEGIDTFYSEVEKQGYKISFTSINEKALLDQVENGNLYLFQIYSKDFSPHAKGNQNLQTMYWKALFEKDNFSDGTVFKLNGGAEIFFRQRTQGLEKKQKSLTTPNAGAIDNKRYTENKILFHCPITLNFTNSKNFKINDMVREYAKKNKMNIIGIDRGEKHLLYFSLIDQQGKVKEMDTLNSIGGVSYYEKLTNKEINRDKERKNRDEIETIKELKEGYISQVVHQLVTLAIEHNAIIVMEDLNSGFKRSRQKIERQIYQKFELALAKKLNFVVSKEKNKSDFGGLYKAYQLAPKIDNFQDIYSQTGIVFYTQASYTSTTCPVCGFRKNVYKKYESVEKTKSFVESLMINKVGEDYTFTYTLPENKDKKGNSLKKTQRTLSTKGQTRLVTSLNKKNVAWETKEYSLTQKFNEIFVNENWKSDASSLKEFMFYWNLLLQIRNSQQGDDGGFLQCPACGFDSKNDFQGKHFNGDANGAYNIARKGIIILNKINNDEKSLGITNVEWDNFSQE